MKLKDLINKYEWDDICYIFVQLYGGSRKKVDTAYKTKVFDVLKKLKPIKNKWSIIIEDCYDEEEKEHYSHVTGRHPDKDKGEQYSLCMTDWAEWLGMSISYKALRKYSKLEIIVHCLWEMTYCGYQEDMDKRWEYFYEVLGKIQKDKLKK